MNIRCDYEIRVPDRAHLRDIQTFKFDVPGDAVADPDIQEFKKTVERTEHERDARNGTDALSRKLAEVSVKQSADRPRDTIESVAVGPIRENPERQDASKTAGPVNGYGTDGIVDLKHTFNKDHRGHDEDARERSDNHCGSTVHESTRSCDRD